MASIFRINRINQESLTAARKQALSLINATVPDVPVCEVGSTAVDGVIGKQDLDFLVRVPARDFVNTRNALDTVFSRNTDQLSNDIYQGYTVDSTLNVAIQLTVEGGSCDNFLAFRDALKACADMRQEYNELKMKFDGLPMSEYREAKHNFIKRVLTTGSCAQ